MPGDDDSGVEWVERDSREWVALSLAPDQMTARMACTYLESAGLEARVGTHGGRYCVEVPAQQYEQALQVHAPADSEIAPPMQEDARKTGVHTGRRLRAALTQLPEDKYEPDPLAPRLIKWAVRIIIIAILIALLLLIFFG